MARRRPAEPTVNPARGAALVVVAVVIGLFLLRNGLDTSEAITSNGGEGRTTDGSDSSDGGDEGTDDTTSTTVAVRPPAEVPTIVLNDSGVAGAAGAYSDVLAAAAYNLTNPDGANEGDASTNSEVTRIYFAPGFEAEAAAVGVAIGAPAAVVPEALPTTPPGPIASASVVVVLGTDLASVTPTTAAG
jgi:LytR cell envelope-related transcriptional attenuator